MFQTFDFADANAVTAKRNDTTVAPQALLMLNGAFVRGESLHFAKPLLQEMPEHPLLARVYRLGLAEEKDGDRPPSGFSSTMCLESRTSAELENQARPLTLAPETFFQGRQPPTVRPSRFSKGLCPWRERGRAVTHRTIPPAYPAKWRRGGEFHHCST